MRLRLAIALLLLVAPTAAAGKSNYVYLHDRGTPSQILAFEWLSDGSLEPIAGSPFAANDDGGFCGGLCQTLTWSNSNKALFAGGPLGIAAFKVKKNGKLKLIDGSPFGPGSGEFFGNDRVTLACNTRLELCSITTIQGFSISR